MKKEKVLLAEWARKTERSMIQELMSVANRPDVISFALGLPAAELFPAQEFACATEYVLATDPHALQYAPPCPSLKEHVVELMSRRGVACRAEQVFLTTGAQQGVNLLANLLLDHGGQLLCEELVYSGFRQAVEPLQPRVLTVPTDFDTGIDTDAVEQQLRTTRPAFIYIVPDGHNPLSVSMSATKRTRLVELARRYRVPIVEDDAYGLMSYEREPLPPLRALDEDWVFYVGTFSKILAPAVRVGWLVVPEELIENLSVVKESSDLNTCTLNQRAIAAYLDTGRLEAHLALLRREYQLRRDAMLEALREHFPPGSRWSEPSSGLFIWVELPRATDMIGLLKNAIEAEQVAFVPGQAFRANGGQPGSRSMRLNFSNSRPALIRDGVARLARAVPSTEFSYTAHPIGRA